MPPTRDIINIRLGSGAGTVVKAIEGALDVGFFFEATHEGEVLYAAIRICCLRRSRNAIAAR
jgi:hypothetical protein